MLLFLCRHAHADRGEPDAARPLSARGRAEAQALAERLAGHATPPRHVVSSPLLRARQTAEVVAAALRVEAEVDARLSPGATASGLRELLAGLDGPVAAICHQPDCSEIALALAGRDPGFPPGGVAEIALP
ncbi:MAG: histidine phosphatase family protein [Thermoleophilia bacterium]|nr:histidine phosphatase family protein [Thermoleophilia bacterium]